MKIKLLSVIGLALLAFVACKQPAADEPTAVTESVDTAEMPDYAAFDQKVAAIRSFIKGHCDENLEVQTELLADTLKWSPPNFNDNQWVGKDDYVAALKMYHDDYENIKFTEGIATVDTLVGGMWSGSVFPKDGATSTPDAIRVYGTWTAMHSATKKDIGVKWFGLIWVNEAGKISQMSEYWDVHGLAAQIADKTDK